MNEHEIELALLEAHENADARRLVDLYQRAGLLREQQDDLDAACFFLTHAMVFAFETGDDRAEALQHKLAEYGRESWPDMSDDQHN